MCDSLIFDQSRSSVCSLCYSKIIFIDEISDRKICEKCSLPYDGFCVDCSETKMNFDKLFSLFLYEDFGQKLIQEFKFKGKFFVINDFKDKIRSKLSSVDFDIVVPVPSDTKKFVNRGYNTSYFIAKLISDIFRRKTVNLLLKRQIKPSQLDLTREERIENPKGAFSLKKSALIYKHKSVLLVDDVATTCSTLSECTRVLREHFDCVWCFTLARAPSYL
ncbi:MAG: hypothetical protein NZ927_09475 [Candidatus Calescibacterium sp.]|nr:hypothetical protein [Candidatus Calescibacterium sp.]MCX7733891.1 hypothetical protein [bacterium]